MFIVRIEMKVKPAAAEALRDYARTEGLSARRMEGCTDYTFLEDVTDPSRVFLYEEWATRQQFETYRASSLFASAGAALRPLLAAPPMSAYYESDDVFRACALPQHG